METNFNTENREALADIISKHNAEYRSGNPKISDAEYDALVEKLREIDPNNQWFDTIEPVVVSASRKVKLPIPMKSLNKAKSLVDIKKWADSLGLPKDSCLVCMPKFDGVSLLCNERTGMAYSRGGSENEGQDCSKHIDKAGIATNNTFLYTYGEFVISNKSWSDNFKGKISQSTGKPFKSPRNTAAGMINSDEPSDLIEHAYFFRYGISEQDIANYDTFSQLIEDLCIIYAQEHLYRKITVNDLDHADFQNLFAEWRNRYPIDGIVVYVDNLSIWERVGRHEGSGNPLYAIAYKHPDFTEAFETTVKGITWNVSKAGALKPVVNIETVDTGDCEMKNPTGYNASWINDMGIAEGAKIIVTRSGGVIPKILSTVEYANSEVQQKMWDELSECPCCGSPTSWGDRYVELYCTNPECPGIRLAKIIHFFTICKAEEMGEESYAKLFVSGFDSIKKILNITPEEILDIDGFGESMVDIILKNNRKIASGVDMATMMHASDCFKGIGKEKANIILNKMAEDDEELCSFYQGWFTYPSDEYIAGQSKTMQAFYNGIRPFYKFIDDNGLKILSPSAKNNMNVNGVCKGMVVCFSGIRDSNLEDKIRNEGGKVSSGVSEKTSVLIVKDPFACTSKIEKAKSLGVKVMNIDDFKYMING